MNPVSTKRPNLFIVGAPKCGTSSMYAYLSQHPEVFMGATKEPKHFCPDLNSHSLRDKRVFVTDLNDYLKLFSDAHDQKWIGEATAVYLFSEDAAKRISTFAADAKIIIMIRNPVDVAHAFHAERLYNGNEDVQCFKTALELEHCRAAGQRLPKNGAIRKALQYRSLVRFSEQIARFLQHFPREQIHFIVFDDLKRDAKNEYRKVLEFLEIDKEFLANFEIRNPSKRHTSRIVRKLIQNREGIVMSAWRTLVPKGFRKAISERIISKTTQKRMPLDNETRQQLESELSTEIDWLSNFLERDLSSWKSMTTNQQPTAVRNT